MNIVICGAGEVGRHAAEVLGADRHANVTVIDPQQHKLSLLEENLDVRTLLGSGTHADLLAEAGCENADLFLAATHIDEINLLSATLAKMVGARCTIARVHHSAYFENHGLDYATKLGIDHLVCPEYSTASEIAQSLRTPGALAMERFAGGRIEMHQLPVSRGAPAVGKPLMSLNLPHSTRICLIEREGKTFLPDGQTAVEPGDVVTLIGDRATFDTACRLMDRDAARRRRVIIMGGTGMGVWLCRALRSRGFSIRLLESDRRRAEELAAKLDWVTVLVADVHDEHLLEEEQVDQLDAFVALTDDDEQNILAAARAKSMGAREAVAVLQRGTYLHLIRHVGIDRAFSPRVAAVTQVQQLLDTRALRHLASLEPGVAEAYQIRVDAERAPAVGSPLREVHFPMRLMIAVVQRGDQAFVPNATDRIERGDTLVVITPTRSESELRKLFGVR